MNILENLYYGNISPCEQFIRPGSQIQKTMQKRDNIETALISSFTDEQKNMFDQYLMLYQATSDLYHSDSAACHLLCIPRHSLCRYKFP